MAKYQTDRSRSIYSKHAHSHVIFVRELPFMTMHDKQIKVRAHFTHSIVALAPHPSIHACTVAHIHHMRMHTCMCLCVWRDALPKALKYDQSDSKRPKREATIKRVYQAEILVANFQYFANEDFVCSIQRLQ